MSTPQKWEVKTAYLCFVPLHPLMSLSYTAEYWLDSLIVYLPSWPESIRQFVYGWWDGNFINTMIYLVGKNDECSFMTAVDLNTIVIFTA